MMLIIRNFVIVVTLAVSAALATPARAVDLPVRTIDPGDVYAVWEQINNALSLYVERTVSDAELIAEIKALQPATFEGLRPADVFALATEVGDQIDHVIEENPSDHLHNGTLLEEEMLYLLGARDGEITPPMVYLRSVFVLEAVAKGLGDHLSSHETMSEYFLFTRTSDRIPSDVYGLVDLAKRRIDLLNAAPATSLEHAH